jgi:iron(III) transport system ATP-binding protein
LPTEVEGTAARATVERARFLGRESLVEFRMLEGGACLRALVPAVFLPKIGTPMWLMLRRDRCMVFPSQAGPSPGGVS